MQSQQVKVVEKLNVFVIRHVKYKESIYYQLELLRFHPVPFV